MLFWMLLSLLEVHGAVHSIPEQWTRNASSFARYGRMARVYRGRTDEVATFLEKVQPAASLSSYGGAIIGIHMGHDASIALSTNGRVQCALELERLFGLRHYYPITETFHEDWRKALAFVRDHCECESYKSNGEIKPDGVGLCPREFEFGVIVGFGMEHPTPFVELPLIVEEVFSVKEWRSVDHQEAHALSGFYDSPFRSALIIAQGLGNDGTFNAYLGRGLDVHRVAKLKYNVASPYDTIATLLPEVLGCPPLCYMTNYPHFDPQRKYTNENEMLKRCKDQYQESVHVTDARKLLSLAGKLMGYAGTGAIIPSIDTPVQDLFAKKSKIIRADDIQHTLVEMACSSIDNQRAMAASAQKAFEELTLSIVASLLERVGAETKVEGIVLTGGPALNVLANELICENLTTGCDAMPPLSSNRPRGIHVPPAANDCGLSVGALWKVAPPLVHQPLQYIGFRLWDLPTLDQVARSRNAQQLSTIGGVQHLAELLAGGPAWLDACDKRKKGQKPIIAIVRGRQEFGPRALGHRSLLAVPDSEEVRNRMNRMKFREWYRPVAPMIADEALEHVFGRKIKSPYMTMAPRVGDDIRKRFPALAHLDGTARHQSVGERDEPWVHSLLLAVGKLTGLAALINTSFNSRGKPITNSVHESLEMLDTLPDLDYVLIEDWLFKAQPA